MTPDSRSAFEGAPVRLVRVKDADPSRPLELLDASEPREDREEPVQAFEVLEVFSAFILSECSTLFSLQMRMPNCEDFGHWDL